MNQSEKQTFTKNERLCRLKLINEIFENGFVFFTKGFKVAWIFASEELPSPAQVAFSIPKKIFRLAVKRNLIRRRIKEAYRKNKHKLYEILSEKDTKIVFILIYRLNSIPEYFTAENYVAEVIEKLGDNVRQKQKKC